MQSLVGVQILACSLAFNSRQTRAVIRKLDSKRERLFWQLESRKFERRE